MNILGTDTDQWVQDIRTAWAQMKRWPLIRWLRPNYSVNLTGPDGRRLAVIDAGDGKGVILPQSGRSDGFSGRLVPADQVLWSRVELPVMSSEMAHAALALECQSLSPFQPEDLAWAGSMVSASEGKTLWQIAIASRRMIRDHLLSVAPAPQSAQGLEVWVQPPQSDDSLLMRGFGESRRYARGTWWMRVNTLMLALLLCVLSVAALTPTAQLRLLALQAVTAAESLQNQSAPMLQQREQLLRLEGQYRALRPYLEKRVNPENLVLRVTQMLPDNTYLTSIRVQDRKVSLVGQTPNAAALMQQMSSQPGIKDVKAPIAATRQRGADREVFNIEFTVDKPADGAQS